MSPWDTMSFLGLFYMSTGAHHRQTVTLWRFFCAQVRLQEHPR